MGRKAFVNPVDRLEAGDVLIVTKIDRLGRNAMDVRAPVERLETAGVRVHCLALGRVDLTSATGKMTMHYFRNFSDDGVKLLIDNLTIFSNTSDHAGKTNTSSNALNLTAGRHSLELQFYQNGGAADLELSSSRTKTGPFPLIGASDGLATNAPEPTTVALLGLGLLGVAASRRRSAKSKNA